MEANYCMVPPNNLMWCCDIVSRFNNDIQSLAHDLQILFKLQQCYKGLQKQFDQLFNQLEKRLEVLSVKKLQSSTDKEKFNPTHADEFVLFIRKVWKALSESLQSENGKARFISFVRVKPLPTYSLLYWTPQYVLGVPLKAIVDELMNFCFHCTRTFLPKFHHQQCSQVFTALSNQLNYYVFPDVEFVDSFEQSLKYLTSSLPCLINMLTIVDLYMYCSKYDRIESLCNDLFANTPPPEFSNFVPPRLLQLPDTNDYCPDFLSDGLDFGYVSYWVPKMTAYIVRMSVVPRRFSTISSQPHGVLSSHYMTCTRIVHQDHPGAESAPGHDRRRRTKSLGRRGYSKDLNPIRVPKLSIQPFAY